MTDRIEEITRLLNEAAEGDDRAARDVMPRIYAELRSLAGRLRGRLPAGETLGVSALVNEAYVRVVAREPEGWKARSHFFHAAARAMRDILVEAARRKSAAKRGGGEAPLGIDDVEVALETPAADVLALHDALARLEGEDPDGHRIVMLRYFAGLTVQEVADVTGVSLTTVERRWRYLKAWLVTALESDDG